MRGDDRPAEYHHISFCQNLDRRAGVSLEPRAPSLQPPSSSFYFAASFLPPSRVATLSNVVLWLGATAVDFDTIWTCDYDPEDKSSLFTARPAIFLGSPGRDGRRSGGGYKKVQEWEAGQRPSCHQEFKVRHQLHPAPAPAPAEQTRHDWANWALLGSHTIIATQQALFPLAPEREIEREIVRERDREGAPTNLANATHTHARTHTLMRAPRLAIRPN